MLARIKLNWKTTVAGVASVCLGIGTLGTALVKGTFTPEIITAGVAAITTGIGLIFGKDL